MKGDPLLPSTQLLIRAKAESWPHRPDPEAVVSRMMVTGRIAFVRTRFGIRRWRIRMVRVASRGRHRGRHFFVGYDRRGWCHVAWLDRVVRVEQLELGP